MAPVTQETWGGRCCCDSLGAGVPGGVWAAPSHCRQQPALRLDSVKLRDSSRGVGGTVAWPSGAAQSGEPGPRGPCSSWGRSRNHDQLTGLTGHGEPGQWRGRARGWRGHRRLRDPQQQAAPPEPPRSCSQQAPTPAPTGCGPGGLAGSRTDTEPARSLPGARSPQPPSAPVPVRLAADHRAFGASPASFLQ